jgi:hypothetical protein
MGKFTELQKWELLLVRVVKEMKLLIQGKLEKSVLGKGTEVACKH